MSASVSWVKKGSGCDKAFFWDDHDKFGWLNYKDGTTKAAELDARSALAVRVNDLLPSIDVTRPAPMLPEGTTPLGYYIARVDMTGTFKPKMCFFEVAKTAAAGKALDAVKQNSGKKAKAKLGLERVQAECDFISGEVGELTLAIDQNTGSVFLLDVGRINGKAGGKELADKAKVGLVKLLAYLG